MHKDFSEEIKKLALQAGFDDAGIASASDLKNYSKKINLAKEKDYFLPIDYLNSSIDLRLDIKKLFPGVRSILIVIKNYYTGDFSDQAKNSAKIARYAWGKDYHQWFKKKLVKLSKEIQNKIPNEKNIWIFNDTKPVLERAWAQEAGLGFIGKSSMFISRKFGTWTLLGGIATDYQLYPDKPYENNHCGSCNKCIEACPTKAIIAPGLLDARKCISTWTIEKPLDNKAKKLAPKNHHWGFGCDICQEVCPWNKFQQHTHEERFQPINGRVFFNVETFRQDLRGSPLNRPRKAGLMANFLRIRKTLKEPNLKIFLKE